MNVCVPFLAGWKVDETLPSLSVSDRILPCRGSRCRPCRRGPHRLALTVAPIMISVPLFTDVALTQPSVRLEVLTTLAVRAETAVPGVTPALAAVTCTVIRWPTSSPVRRYVCAGGVADRHAVTQPLPGERQAGLVPLAVERRQERADLRARRARPVRPSPPAQVRPADRRPCRSCASRSHPGCRPRRWHGSRPCEPRRRP